MDFKKFEDQFHPSWHAKMRPFIESNECNDIYAFLKKERRGVRKLPLSLCMFGDALEKLH